MDKRDNLDKGELGELGEFANDKPKEKKQAKHDSGLADLEKVTDYAEETEIGSVNDLSAAIHRIGTQKAKEDSERLEREKELAKIVVTKEDIELLVNELDISRQAAELSLRQNQGDVVQALRSLTN